MGQFECAASEWLGNQGVIVLSIYRPSGGIIGVLEKVLSLILEENKLVIITGDFNIDLLDMDMSSNIR